MTYLSRQIHLKSHALVKQNKKRSHNNIYIINKPIESKIEQLITW